MKPCTHSIQLWHQTLPLIAFFKVLKWTGLLPEIVLSILIAKYIYIYIYIYIMLYCYSSKVKYWALFISCATKVAEFSKCSYRFVMLEKAESSSCGHGVATPVYYKAYSVQVSANFSSYMHTSFAFLYKALFNMPSLHYYQITWRWSIQFDFATASP